MKKSTLFLLTFLTTLTMFGQDITGQWNGILKVQETQLRVVFNINKSDSGYSSTMDSPDQGAKGIPVTSTSFENSVLKLEISNAKIEYVGTLDKENSFIGNFKQGGESFPMNLSREKIEKEKVVRPQEPTKPYSYYTEDVIFENKKDKITLSGTLTLPKKEGNYPVVILITGSGPQNRDEELLGHKPFLVIADYLTKNGIAVLRFDDRGIGESKGDFKTATTLDFATDVESAIKYLQTRKEIDKKKIGLIGHSEGGMIAPMVASTSKDVAFIILMAGPGISIDELLVLQSEKTALLAGADTSLINTNSQLQRGMYSIIKENTTQNLEKQLTDYLKNKFDSLPKEMKPPTEEEINQLIQTQVKTVTNAWFQFFVKYEPEKALSKIKCPVLAINGSLDSQVLSKENLGGIEKALIKGQNKNYKIVELQGLNHLFQEAKTGAFEEYAKIEQTISPIALTEITNWIIQQIK